ncbi:MAG: diguanylate cyclase, partial [Betaproteobacteria bacterium]
MTRQVYELAEQQSGVRGHITSLKPLRPQNAPDEWEQRALSAFETGTTEITALDQLDGISYLRFMRPLMVEKPCLLCHKKQGYEVGDIRGGISIAVPFAPYTKIAERQIQHYLIGHALFGILGLIGIWVFFRRIEQTEDLLRASEFRFKFAIEGVGYGVWDWNIEQGVTHYSKRSMEMLGYAGDDFKLSHQEWIATIRTEDQAGVEQAMQDYLNGKTPAYSIEYALKCKDGSFKWIMSRGMAVSRDKTGRPLRVIGTHSDITDRHALEEKIHELAYYDPLTQLPNRRLLNDRLDQALMASRRDDRYGAVLFLDMDNFKPLNDTYGHEAGDQMLIEVAERLRKCVRATDTVARFGGDEFVVILNAVGEDKKEATSQAGNVAEKIRATLASIYRLQVSSKGQPKALIEHHSTASIGVVLFKSRGAVHEDLLKLADAAMYAAKRAGRNAVRFQLDEEIFQRPEINSA